MDGPLVEVCIVTNNRVDLLRRCIESVMMQSYKNVELFIFDNCTTDETNDYLWELTNNEVDIHWVIPSQPMDAITSLNYLFEQVIAPYILVLDDDAELIDSKTIEKLVDFMERDADIAIVGTNVIGDDGNPQMIYRWSDGNPMQSTNGVFYYFDFKGACALFRTSHVAPLGYYNEAFKIYMNELDLSCKALKNGQHIMIHGGIKVLHHGVNKIGNPSQYLNNYNTVLYDNFYKMNAAIMFILNYFIVSYRAGGWFKNALITTKWMMKLLVRVRCNCISWYWQETLLNGTIRAIKDAI